MGSVPPPTKRRYDVLIIGAGLSGICSLHHIRHRFPTWHIRVLEAGAGVGGTWYWNRYPGARFDSESVSYGYSWDPELLEQWHWTETFSPQKQTLKYIERVCEKHDLYKDIQLNSRVTSAHWRESDRSWLLQDEGRGTYQSRFLVSCLGFLSSPTLPNIPGLQDFGGESFHTSRWPETLDMSRDFANQRIGIIGTGASGIQTITEIAKEPSIKSLTVFQRTPNWSAPLRNSKISSEQMTQLRSQYGTVFETCGKTPMGFLHQADPRNSLELSKEERQVLWDELYQKPGFGKWIGVFKDTYVNREANRLYSEYMADKIRQRVHDPDVADRLIPKSHGFGTRRVPLESGYFEAFNRPNVRLVDLQETPIARATSLGIRTADGTEHKLDKLIFATGFDAITGAFKDIDWHAKDGLSLLRSDEGQSKRPIWDGHRPRTFLGIMIPAMPNNFMVLGPHQPFGNATRSIEHAVGVVSDLLQYCHDHDYTYVEPSEQAVEGWTEHVLECSKGQLSNEVDSWMTGVNTNVQGKGIRSVARYAGHAAEFRRRCADCQASGWDGLIFA